MPMMPVRRDAATAAFFDGTARGELLLVRDTQTGEILDPHTDTAYARERFERVPASGRGVVVSWAVPHNPGPDGTTSQSVVGIVELEEGPWWWTEIRGFAPDDTLGGAPVTVGFERSGDGAHDEVIPYFVSAR